MKISDLKLFFETSSRRFLQLSAAQAILEEWLYTAKLLPLGKYVSFCIINQKHDNISTQVCLQLINAIKSHNTYGYLFTKHSLRANIVFAFITTETTQAEIDELKKLHDRQLKFIFLTTTNLSVSLEGLKNVILLTPSSPNAKNTHFYNQAFKNNQMQILEFPIHQLIAHQHNEDAYHIAMLDYMPHVSKLGYYPLIANSLNQSYKCLRIQFESKEDLMQFHHDTSHMNHIINWQELYADLLLSQRSHLELEMMNEHAQNVLFSRIHRAYQSLYPNDYAYQKTEHFFISQWFEDTFPWFFKGLSILRRRIKLLKRKVMVRFKRKFAK